jgi:hypothetical protein
MKNKKAFIILMLGLLCFCCTNNNYYNDISNTVNAYLEDSLKHYEKIIIIPGSGCNGCISNAEKFFLQNVKNEKIKFILTYNFSRKNLLLKLKKENISRSNVLIDDNNIFYLRRYEERIYPVTIKIINGKITEIEINGISKFI